MLKILNELAPAKIALAGLLLVLVAAGVQEVRIQYLKTDLADARVVIAQGKANIAEKTQQLDACFITVREQNNAINDLWLAGQQIQTDSALRSTVSLLQSERDRKTADQPITSPEEFNRWMQLAFP